MAVTINADNGAVSGSSGLKYSADSTGVLALQTNGTTAVSISTGQVVTLTNALPVASGGTGVTTATAGFNALAPSQTGNNGKYLTTDGSNTSWGTLSVTPTAVSDQNNTSTGYFDLPSGTTAERPGSPVVGMIRYNTTIGVYEVYTTLGWAYAPLTYLQFSIDYLVVAGGGGGNGAVNDFTIAGGGGAGGFRTGTGQSFNLGDSFTVTVGAGGPGMTYTQAGSVGNGSNSVFSSFTSTGGGGAASFATLPSTGGSGGGGGAGDNPTGAAGTSGQGNSGGTGTNFAGKGGGGGGGASAVGGNGATNAGGAGGAGTASSYSGSSVTYAGGGGGAGASSGGAGGAGGGGNGAVYNGDGGAGTANRGGGGGGAARNNAAGQQTGGAGGSGIVILRYSSALGNITSIGGGLTYTGPTTSGGYKIYVFTAGTGTVTL